MHAAARTLSSQPEGSALPIDDLTKQTLAEAFGKKLIFNEEEADKIRSFFKERLHNMEMTEKQPAAGIPAGGLYDLPQRESEQRRVARLNQTATHVLIAARPAQGMPRYDGKLCAAIPEGTVGFGNPLTQYPYLWYG